MNYIQCILCKKKVSKTEGIFDCEIHPDIYDHRNAKILDDIFTRRMRCCKIIANQVPYIKRWYGRIGCMKIEHCESQEEIIDILENPFKIVNSKDYYGVMENVVYKIKNDKELNSKIFYNDFDNKKHSFNVKQNFLKNHSEDNVITITTPNYLMQESIQPETFYIFKRRSFETEDLSIKFKYELSKLE